MLMSDLTKRERFARSAMHGLIQNNEWCRQALQCAPDTPVEVSVAIASREVADALLAELEKTAPKPVADNDGWIAHKPGDADGPPDDAACSRHIEVRFRNNETHFIRNPHALHWTDTGGPHTIIAWRPAR